MLRDAKCDAGALLVADREAKEVKRVFRRVPQHARLLRDREEDRGEAFVEIAADGLRGRLHHALRLAGQKLATKLNVTPEPPSDDPVKAAGTSEMAALQAAPKGAQFDRTYIEQEVAIHKAVLDLAEKAHGQAKNGELKALIEQAKPVIEKHLAKAEEIQKKLAKPTA